MSQPRVARQSTDIVLKLIAAALGGDLFARFGVPLPPIVEALPTELPQLEVRTQHTDQLFRLADDSIVHLEFQTTQRCHSVFSCFVPLASFHDRLVAREKLATRLPPVADRTSGSLPRFPISCTLFKLRLTLPPGEKFVGSPSC